MKRDWKYDKWIILRQVGSTSDIIESSNYGIYDLRFFFRSVVKYTMNICDMTLYVSETEKQTNKTENNKWKKGRKKTRSWWN